MHGKLSYRDLPGSERYSKLSIAALKELLKERQLRVAGSKTELIAKLLHQDKERRARAAPAAPAAAAASAPPAKAVSPVQTRGRKSKMSAPAVPPAPAAPAAASAAPSASHPARDVSPVQARGRKAKMSAPAVPPTPAAHPAAAAAHRAPAASLLSSQAGSPRQTQGRNTRNLQGARMEDALVEIGNVDSGMGAAPQRGRPQKRAAEVDDRDAGESAPPPMKRKKTPMTRSMPQSLFAKDGAEVEAENARRPTRTDHDIIALASERAARRMLQENDDVVLTNDVHYVMADLMKFFYRKVMDRAASLARFVGHSKITQRDIQAALQICMGGEIVDGMQVRGIERAQEYHDYRLAQEM
eukprot:GEMP01022729.1.p1 GENE.GEMP01022729.1~~GEMP01022729.1.p1  ORF type:complete len:356 (+),score=77.52 GEMP01022729.1:64-1131(+)